MADYDRMKSKLENHHNIVSSMQGTYEVQMRNLYKEKEEIESRLEGELKLKVEENRGLKEEN